MEFDSYSASTAGTGQGHVCNCIGCCKKCGQCLTAPWHSATCGSIAALNKARKFIIDEAMKPKKVDHVQEEEKKTDV
jgi:hypothetical protein